MSKLSTAIRLIRTNRGVFLASVLENLNFLFPDKLYLELMFRFKMGYKLDLECPRTFNEKIQWLKLYDRNPLYTILVDKYAAKKWVADKIGEEYIIPTLGVWNCTSEIDFDSLPNQFVLKTTNGSGGCDVVICKDKSKFDKKKAIEHLKRSLKKNVYKTHREWPYKNVIPRIIAEKYIEDEHGELNDYKLYCFDGVVKCLHVDYDRFTEHHRNMYDVNWNQLNFSIKYQSKNGVVIEKPKNLNKMIEIAETLSKGMTHVRVDLYNISGKIFFGEMTFYHASGYKKFNPREWDIQFGEWIKIKHQ